MEGRGPSASRRDQPWSENNQDTWVDHQNIEEKAKKDKKWSIGKLFRRKKKDTESESSDSSNDNSQKQKKRKSHSKKRESSSRNNVDHIIVNNKRSQSVTKAHKKEYPDEGVLSDPSAGFVGYVGRGLPRSPFDRSHFSGKDSLERRGAGSSTGSQDGSLRKGRKGRIKARVEAIRNLKHESSSDEESQKSTSSSILKFRSDDSLANHSKDGSIGRRTRSARTDRYIKRLSRDDEVQLNREADLIQKGFSRSEAELMALKQRVLSTPQMVEHDRSIEDPDYSEPHIVSQGYDMKMSQDSGLKPQVSAYANVQRGDSNARINLRQPALSASNSSVYSYPAGVINFNAQVNNENITYSVPYNNIKKNPKSDSLPNKPTFRRSASVENGNGVYGSVVPDEDVIVVKFPLGSAVKKENPPPPPPPRDPQRKIPTPISSMYENSRPLSYAFEPSPQTNVPFRKSDDTSMMAPIEYRTSKNIYQNNVPNHSVNALNWSKRPTSTSEDHIAMQQNNYNPSAINHYSNEQPRRPSSVTGETLRPEIYNRYLARPQINRVNMPNSVPRRHTQENTNPEFQYYADKTPRSRKPIHITKTLTNPELVSAVDSKVPAPPNVTSQRPRNASDFWRKMDSQASQRKPFGHNRALSDTSISSGIFNGQNNNSTVNSNIRNTMKPSVTNGFQENDRLKPSNFRNNSMYNNRINNDNVSQRVKKEEEPICYSNIDIIPMDDIRKGSQSGKNSDEDPSRGRRKSTNLEDALSELEAIYNSLGLGDEDLLDRAERRELTTPKTTEQYPFSSSDRENYFRFPSYSDYPDSASVLKKQNQFNRRSSIPDKMHDDMAYRRMNPHERPKSKDVNNLASQVSYMLSPTLADQQGLLQNEESTDDKEPDVILDDVVFRNLRQANNYLKIEDPQPPFGIPIGPVSPAPHSDYLHVTPEVKSRSRFIPQESPDVVTDDLAYRSLRKDRNASPLGNAPVEVLINNSSENKSMSQPSKMFDNHVTKKKKAVRSMSANIFSMIQREIDDALGLCSSRALEKAQSIPDLPDAVVEFGKSGKIPNNFRASQIIEQTPTMTPAAPSRLAPNYDIEARTNARNSFLFNVDDKVANRPPVSVTPDKSPKDSSSGYRKPLSPRITQSETEYALDMMAEEANETSAKLVLALEELQKDKSPLKLKDEPKQVSIKSRIEDSNQLKTNNNTVKLNFLNDRSVVQNVENNTRVSAPKAAERRKLFDDNDYVNITEFSNFRSGIVDNKVENHGSQGKGRSTEDSLIAISNQLKIAGNKIKSSEYQDNFEDEGAKLRALAKQCDINLNKNLSQAGMKELENKVTKEPKFAPFEYSIAKSQPSSYDGKSHGNNTLVNTSSTTKTTFLNDSKVGTLEEMQSFDDLRKGISDLLEDITNVTDKYKAKKIEELNDNERNGKESPIELSCRDDESEKSKDNRGSPEYNSSEELAMIFNLTKEDTKSSDQDRKNGGEKDSHMDLNSPRLVNTVNQNFRKTSKDETKPTEISKPSSTASQAPTASDVPWRVNRRQPTADSASKGNVHYEDPQRRGRRQPPDYQPPPPPVQTSSAFAEVKQLRSRPKKFQWEKPFFEDIKIIARGFGEIVDRPRPPLVESPCLNDAIGEKFDVPNPEGHLTKGQSSRGRGRKIKRRPERRVTVHTAENIFALSSPSKAEPAISHTASEKNKIEPIQPSSHSGEIGGPSVEKKIAVSGSGRIKSIADLNKEIPFKRLCTPVADLNTSTDNLTSYVRSFEDLWTKEADRFVGVAGERPSQEFDRVTLFDFDGNEDFTTMAGTDDGKTERVRRYKEERRRQLAAANGSGATRSPIRLDRVQSERVSSSSRIDDDATSSLERKSNLASGRVRTTRASRLRAAVAALSAAESSPKTSPTQVSPRTIRDSLIEPAACRLSGIAAHGESRPNYPVSSGEVKSSNTVLRPSKIDLQVPILRLNRLSLDLDSKLVGDLPHSADSAFKPPNNLKQQSRDRFLNRNSNRFSLDLEAKNLESASNGDVVSSKDDLLNSIKRLKELSLNIFKDKDGVALGNTRSDMVQKVPNDGRICSDSASNGVAVVKSVDEVVPSEIDNVFDICDSLNTCLNVSGADEDEESRKAAVPANSHVDGTGATSGCQRGTCRRSSHPKPSPPKEKDSRQDEGVIKRGRLTSASFGLRTEASNYDHQQAHKTQPLKTSPPRTTAPVLNRRASPKSYASPRSSSQSPLSSPSAIKIQQKRRSVEINSRNSSATSPGPVNGRSPEANLKSINDSSSKKLVKKKSEKVIPKPTMLTRAAKLRQDKLEAGEEIRADSEPNRIKKRLTTPPNSCDNRLNGATDDKDKKCDRRSQENTARSPVNNRELRQKAQSLDIDNRESSKMSSVDSRLMKSDKKSIANRRLTSRMDALAALTKETLAKVDRLTKKTPEPDSAVAQGNYQVPVTTHSKFTTSYIDRPLDDIATSNSKDFAVHSVSNGGPSTSRGVIERLSDIDAVTQHLLEFERQSSTASFIGENQSDVREPARKNSEQSTPLLSYTPVSILKRKSSQEEHGSVSTPPVTFSPSVVDHGPSKPRRHGQGILKKRRSLDESQVNRHRSCSPEVAFADDCDSDTRPTLKSQRRSSLEELIRGRSPDGIQGILKRKYSRDGELIADDNRSLGSPEPQGILKRKSNSSSSSSTASSHVSIAQAVILAAAGGAELIEDKDGVRPILKKKSFSEEHPCSEIYNIDVPKPILKKKSLTENDDNEYDRPKKTILKGARKISHDDGNASSSFDLSEDDRGSRRSSVMRHRSSDVSEGESNVRPILKQRGYTHSREHSQSPRPRLSFCSDDEHQPSPHHENNAQHRNAADNDARYFSPPAECSNHNVQSPAEDESPVRPSRFESGRLHSPSKLNNIFDGTSPPSSPTYSNVVMRKRNLRSKPVGRSKSLASNFSEELDQILSSRRNRVEDDVQNGDSVMGSEDASPSAADSVDEPAAAAGFPSIAQRIQSMEQYFGVSKVASGAIPKHRQLRNKDRFMTQPVTMNELRSIPSLDFSQGAFQRRQPSPQTDERTNLENRAEESSFTRNNPDDYSEFSTEDKEESISPEGFQSPSKIGNFVTNPYYIEPPTKRDHIPRNFSPDTSPLPEGSRAPKSTPITRTSAERRRHLFPERRRTFGDFEEREFESPERRRTSGEFDVTSSTYNNNYSSAGYSDILNSPERVRQAELARNRTSDEALHRIHKILNDSKESPITKEFNKIFEETTRRNSKSAEDSQLDKLIWDLYAQSHTDEAPKVSSAKVSSSADGPLSLADLSPRQANLDVKFSPTKRERPRKLFESPEKEIGYQKGGREATLQELDRLEVELEDVRTALDVDSSALCGVDADHWSLNVSVDSGVFNRMSSGDSGPLSGEEPSLPQDFSKQPDVIPKSPITKQMKAAEIARISPIIDKKVLYPSSPTNQMEREEAADVVRQSSPVKCQNDSDDSSDDDGAEVEDANNPRALHGLMKSNSVSARASMWQQMQTMASKAAIKPVLRHSRSKVNDGSPSVLDRYKTQPITLEEVTIAANENSPNPLNQSRSSFNLTLEQDEDAKLDENDPAKLTLAEKMKLFGAKISPKPPMGNIKKPRSPRFQTMPVLASEVDDARQFNAKQHNLIVKDDMADIPSPRHKMIKLDLKPPFPVDVSKNRRSLIENKTAAPITLTQRANSESVIDGKKPPNKNTSKESPEHDGQSKQKKELAGLNFRLAQNKLAEQASRMLTSEVKGILKSRTGAVPLLPSAVDAAVKKSVTDEVQPAAKGKDASHKTKTAAKTLTKGESSEGLKDEGIDSSSEEEEEASASTSSNSSDQSCSSSDSSEESEEEHSASPEPTLVKPSMLKSCRTESDLTRRRNEENDLKAGGKIKLPCMDEMRAREIMERCMMRSSSSAKVSTPTPAVRTNTILASKIVEKTVVDGANLSAVVQLKNLKNGSLSPVKPVENVLGNGKAIRKNENLVDEVPDLVKKYVPQVVSNSSTVHTFNSKLMQEMKLRRGVGAGLARSAILREDLEGSGSDGESSGGREVRHINSRRRGMRGAFPPAQEPSAPPAVLPPGLQNSPWGLRRSATQPMAAAMPQRGVTIAERLAALQQSGNNDWRKRVSKLSPDDDVTNVITATKNKINETLTQQAEEQRRAAQLGPADLPGDQIISDRRIKLETSAQGWRKRVGQNDATAFSVAGRMDKDGLAPVSPVITPLTPAASQDKCTPQASRFRSRKADGITPSGPMKSASTAIMSQPASPLRSAAQFRRSISTSGMDDIQSPSENTVMTKSEDGSKVNGSAAPGPSVPVPRADDETFTSFFQSASQTVVTTSSSAYIPYNNNNNDIPLIPEDIDLDAIDSGTRHMLGGAAGNRVRAARRLGGSRNPLRTLAARTDLRQEYTQPPLTGVADKETARINKDKLAQNSSMAVEALAGLAAREDFTTIHLKRASPPRGLACSQSSGFGLDFAKSSLLIHVKGRRHVQARLAEPNHASINSGDCFVLVTADQVFNYAGYYANVIERSRAAEIALHIHMTKDLGCANSSSVITLDEQHKNRSSKQWKQFWALLDVDEDELEDFKPTPAGNADEDEIFESGIIPTNMCYEVIDDELVPVQEYWGQVPKIAMLDPSKILVFDFGSELYVWNGKNTILEVRRTAFQLAQELWDEGYDYKDCHLCPLSIPRMLGARTEIEELPKKGTSRPEWAMITKVTQHMENILFKDKFLDWPDFSRVIKVKEEEDSLKGGAVEIKPCNAEEMWNKEYEDPSLVLELSHVGRGTRHYDKETMRNFEVKTKSVTKWIIQEYDYCKIDAEDLNEFYSGDSYIIRWEYQMTVTGRELNGKPSKHNLTGRDRCAYFCWQGKDASANEKGAAALLTVELDQEKGPQVRVAQGSEPPAFLNLFNGSLVIHQGKKGADKSKHRLFMVRGNVANESHLVQVPCSMRQLRSRASMVAVDKENSQVYVWHGVKSLKHTRAMAVECAKLISEKQSLELFEEGSEEVELTEVEEGDEPKAVIDMLGGANRQLYHSLVTKGFEDNSKSVTPRLFHFTDLSGQFDAVEVLSPLRHETLITPYPFSQQELYSASQPGLFLLDSGDSLWLWQGWWPQHGDNELIEAGSGTGTLRWQCCRRAAMETVLEYWKVSRPDAREPVASVVVAGLEPLEFINLFDAWQDRDDVAEMNIAYGHKVGEGICSVSEELCRLSKTSFPLAVLRQRPLPDAVDPANIERYLTDQVFQETFGLTKEEFYHLPSWKQANIKKDLGLF